MTAERGTRTRNTEAALQLQGRLRDQITSGKRAPGAHLTEIALAREFGVSRTPVRTALRGLADEGLITIEPNRGAFVALWTSDDAAEIMRLRTVLESHAAERAANNRREEQLEHLYRCCQQMEDAEVSDDPDSRSALAAMNREFHEAVLAAANSPRLYVIGCELARTPLMSSSFQYYSESQTHRSLGDHRMITDAIRDRDTRTAHALMNAHLSVAYSVLTRQSGTTDG